MNIKEISVGLTIGLLIGAGIGYLVPQSQIAALQDEITNLAAMTSDYERNITQLDTNILSLEDNLENQTALITLLHQDVSELEELYSEIHSDHEALLVESEILSSDYESLQNEHDVLESDHTNLQSEYIDYLIDYQQMWTKYNELIQSYAILSGAIPVGQRIVTEIPGVINGDFSESEGWVKQGKGGQGPPYATLWQYPSTSYLIQTITFTSEDQGIIFSFKPAPYGAEVGFRVSIGGITVYTGIYAGINDNFDWEEVVIPFKPIWNMKELYGYEGGGNDEIRFTVESGEDNGARVSVDDVSLITIEYQPEEPASNQTVSVAPNIDGYREVGEWADFQESTLEYWVTYNYSIRSDSSAWDTNEKSMSSSILLDDTHLYACFLIPDDYLSEEFQIRSVNLKINGYPETTIRWTSQHEYRSNSWATYGANAQYSHSSDGMSGADGTYTIELSYPIGNLEVNEVSIQYVEVTRYTAQGFFEISSYWVSDSLSITRLDGTQ